eukprot:c17346_g1_i2 orf=464-1315(+)
MLTRWTRASFVLCHHNTCLHQIMIAPASCCHVSALLSNGAFKSIPHQASGSSEENGEKLAFVPKAPCSLVLPLDSKLRVVDPEHIGLRGLALRILGFHSRQSKLIRGAHILYSRITNQVEKPEFYAGFNLEKSFRTTHALLVLHMWMCLARLRVEDKNCTEFGQFLYEIFNHDVEQRVATAGVKMLLSKWMKELEKMFYGAVLVYDAAMQPEASRDDLPRALWRNVFAEDDSGMPIGPLVIPVQALASYTRRELTCLSLTDRDAILSGNILFTADFVLGEVPQ